MYLGTLWRNAHTFFSSGLTVAKARCSSGVMIAVLYYDFAVILRRCIIDYNLNPHSSTARRSTSEGATTTGSIAPCLLHDSHDGGHPSDLDFGIRKKTRGWRVR